MEDCRLVKALAVKNFIAKKEGGPANEQSGLENGPKFIPSYPISSKSVSEYGLSHT